MVSFFCNCCCGCGSFGELRNFFSRAFSSFSAFTYSKREVLDSSIRDALALDMASSLSSSINRIFICFSSIRTSFVGLTFNYITCLV